MQWQPFGISAHFSAESAALAACGGALLGTTVIFKTLFTGSVLGVSGSTRGLLVRFSSLDKAAFVLGLALAGRVMATAYGGFEPMPPRGGAEGARLPVRLFLGGLLVGLGTAFGNGCTSGHGLTGLARLSPRSWASVPTFMAAGCAAATFAGTSGVLPPDAAVEAAVPGVRTGAMLAASGAAALALLAAVVLALRGSAAASALTAFVELVSGLSFGTGLAISGMARPSKVAAFLDVGSGAWDPSLVFVMGSALALTFPFFQILERRQGSSPIIGRAFEFPPKSKPIDGTLLAGALLFGIGWGIAGACPGPVWVLLLAVPSLEIVAIFVGMLVGMEVWVLSQRKPKASKELNAPLLEGAGAAQQAGGSGPK